MSHTLHSTAAQSANDQLSYAIYLELKVTDGDTIGALERYPEGSPREQFALEAIKIGVLALRHAVGALDADFIQRETNRLLETLRGQLDEHARLAQTRLVGSLKEYFDPESGRFSQRVKRLTADDGELSQLLRGLLDGDDSRLAKTLLSHVGESSPLMKLLSPDQSQGLLATLRGNVEGQLSQHREKILSEFSLNNHKGALFQLVRELKTNHGDLSRDLQTKINEVVKEFSLDEENSALSRLVNKVDGAQKKITEEFSLDNKQSALHHLKEELTTILAAHVKANAEFQEEVKVALGKLTAKRETEARGTQHGLAFEDAVCEFLMREAQAAGDIATSTGHTTGLIKNCKVGDCVVELGPDSAAPGAKIAVEAKEDASYTLARAREEIETARKNRGADWGLFVFSKATAPAGLESFQRYGHDLVVVWDAEDCGSDVFFKAGIVTARALCFRAGRQVETQSADFEAIDRAILEIEKRAGNLDAIRKHVETIQSSSEKILDRVRKDRKSLEQQVNTLRDKVGELKSLLGSEV